MKKILFLFLFLFVGLFYSSGMEFQRLSGTPTLNAQVDVRETCTLYEMDYLTFCTGYYNDKMYIHFYIKDYTYSANDTFGLFFDLDNNNQNDGYEPLIFIRRDGSVLGYTYGEMQYYVDSGIGKSVPWRGELTIPFEVLGLSRELNDKTIYGPNISVYAYDVSQGIIDKFQSPPGALWTQTYSNTYWSNPKPIVISKENLQDVEMYAQSLSNVEMMKLKILTNNEELYKITKLKIKATGTNANEQVQINEVNLYSNRSGELKLIGSEVYDGDDGSVEFNIDETIYANYTELNPYYLIIEYNISEHLQLDVPDPSVIFNFDLISVSALGIYTNKSLTVNGLPFNSILLTAFECFDDNGCGETEFCNNKWCDLVLIESDCGYVSNHKWINYDCCKKEDCVEGNCIDHKCIIEPSQEELPPVVEEPPPIVDEPPNGIEEPPIDVPGINETNQTELNNTINGSENDECISIECTDYVWGKCECFENPIVGIKKGTSIDNCNKTIFKYDECNCDIVGLENQTGIINEEKKELSIIDIIVGTIVLLIVLFFIHKTFYKK